MKQRTVLATKSLAFAVLVLGHAASQRTAPKSAQRPAPNAWLLIPTPYLAWNQDISPSLRAQRDNFWDKSSFREAPITDRAAEATAVPTGEDFSSTEPEIVDVPNRAVLTATFTKFRSVLSTSEFSLYTEVTLHVDKVFEDRTGSGQPFAGRDISVLLHGGTVTLRSGRTLTENTAPREFFLQPDHKYLVALTYYAVGDFYLCADNWDISDGAVRANTYRSQYFAKIAPSSSLSGLPVQQLGPSLDKRLSGH